MKKSAALALALVLLFVWSLPGTIALRHLLMLVSILLLADRSVCRNVADALRSNRGTTGLVALLTFWLVVQAIFVSNETRWALRELGGQWLMAGLALLIGAGLAAEGRIGRMEAVHVTTLLIVVLLGQAAISVGQSIAWWFEHGELLREAVPLTGGKLEMSYLINILLAALTVDLLYRIMGHGGFLSMSGPAVFGALLLGLAGAFIAGARNGVLGTLFLSLSALTFFAIEQGRRKGFRSAMLFSISLICVIAAFAVVNVQADRRWASFHESARLGWDIDSNKAWVNSAEIPFPELPGGGSVEQSAYIRVAFIHASLRLIGESPLGVGYGRNAFAHALRQTETTNVGHAHSGFLDLGIGGGIPAMLLWVAFIGSLMATGWRRHFRDGDPHGLLLLLLATGYMGRMMLDSVNRDHMLQIFMFLVGYLLTVSPVARQHRVAASPNAHPPT